MRVPTGSRRSYPGSIPPCGRFLTAAFASDGKGSSSVCALGRSDRPSDRLPSGRPAARHRCARLDPIES